jgi:hypothetical protein
MQNREVLNVRFTHFSNLIRDLQRVLTSSGVNVEAQQRRLIFVREAIEEAVDHGRDLQCRNQFLE